MLKQYVAPLTKQSLICVCPEEGNGAKRLRKCSVGNRGRWSVPECPVLGTVNSSAQGRLPVEFTSPCSSKQGCCWVAALQACLLSPKHCSYKNIPLRKAQGAFQICGKNKIIKLFSSIIVPALLSLKEGTSVHTGMILQNPGQAQKQNNTNQYYPK